MLELALQGKSIQRGSENSAGKVSTRDGNSSLKFSLSRALYGGIYRCLSAQRLHVRTLVPSGTWIIPRIFPQGRVTDCHYRKAITNWARNTLLNAGPVTMGRIPHGPPDLVRTWGGKTSSSAFVVSLRLAVRRTGGGPHRHHASVGAAR